MAASRIWRSSRTRAKPMPPAIKDAQTRPAWSWLATASLQHCLLICGHLKTGELAFHYCFVPEGQPLTLTRLIRAAGLRWPVEVGHF